MTNRGKAHEAIVAELVDQIKKEDSVQTVVVEPYKNLIGTSGATHQFDIYWEFQIGVQTHRCVIEAKHWDKLVSLRELSRLRKAINDLHVSPTGVFLGSSRFKRRARAYAAHYGLDVVREYDEQGKVVMEVPIKGGPHSVVRLPNGNTLIACSDHNGEPKVAEFDRNGKIVWQVLKNDLPSIELKFMTGLQRLPNGNTIMTNWLGHNQFGKAPHAIEVTRDKKVVWTYNDNSFIQTMSSIQLIDSGKDFRLDEIMH